MLEPVPSIFPPRFSFYFLAKEPAQAWGVESGRKRSRFRQEVNPWLNSSRDFYTDVSAGNTAALQIYNHSATRLTGSAAMRPAEEAPWAVDDTMDTPAGQVVDILPLANDRRNVRSGAVNAGLGSGDMASSGSAAHRRLHQSVVRCVCAAGRGTLPAARRLRPLHPRVRLSRSLSMNLFTCGTLMDHGPGHLVTVRRRNANANPPCSTAMTCESCRV